MMLGTRRPAVNAVSKTIQRMGLIRHTCGRVQVLNRAGLASCGCFATITREFVRVKL
jgi:hypothetical protein